MYRQILEDDEMNDKQISTPKKKWKSKIKKLVSGIVILGALSGIYWLFSPLIWVKNGIFWNRVNLGEHKTMKDMYYVNISGITYADDKFYINLIKPYVFNVFNEYVYSSKNLTNWSDEYHYRNDTGIPVIVDSDNKQIKFATNGNFFTYLDKYGKLNRESELKGLMVKRNNDCFTVSLVSYGCNGKWKYYDVSDYSEVVRDIYFKAKNFNDFCHIIFDNYPQEKLALGYCSFQHYPKLNEDAYSVINNINKKNHLNLAIGVAHTTYGNGKYVGIFYKNKQYYFIISTDGINYKIEPVPSELTSSLAIKLFN